MSEVPQNSPSRKKGLRTKTVPKDSKYSGTRSKSTRSTFTLRVLKGTHLLASDIQREPPTSDPICFVWCGTPAQTPSVHDPLPEGINWAQGTAREGNPFYTTKVVYGTIDPTWNEEIIIPLEEILVGNEADREFDGGTQTEVDALSPDALLAKLMESKCYIYIRDEDQDGETKLVSFDDLGMLEWSFKDLVARARPMANGLTINAQPYRIDKTPGMPNLGLNIDLGTLTLGAALTLEDDDLGKLLKAALGEPDFKGKQLIERLQRHAKDLPMNLPTRPSTADSVRGSRDRGRSISPALQRPSTSGVSSRPSSSSGDRARSTRSFSAERLVPEPTFGEDENLQQIAEIEAGDEEAVIDLLEKPQAQEISETEGSSMWPNSQKYDNLLEEMKTQWWTPICEIDNDEDKTAKIAEYQSIIEEWSSRGNQLIVEVAELEAEIANITAEGDNDASIDVSERLAAKKSELDALGTNNNALTYRIEAYQAMLSDIQEFIELEALSVKLRQAVNSALDSLDDEHKPAARKQLIKDFTEEALDIPMPRARKVYETVMAELAVADENSSQDADKNESTEAKESKDTESNMNVDTPEITGEPQIDNSSVLGPKPSDEPVLKAETTPVLSGAGSKAAMALRDRDRDILTKSLEELTRITQEGFKGLDTRLTAVERSIDKEDLIASAPGAKKKASTKIASKPPTSGTKKVIRSSREDSLSQLSQNASKTSVSSRASGQSESFRKQLRQSRDSSDHGTGSAASLIYKTVDGIVCSAPLGDENAISPNRRSQDLFGGTVIANPGSPLKDISQASHGHGHGSIHGVKGGHVDMMSDKSVGKPPPPAPLNGVFPLATPLPAAPDWGRVTLWLRGGDLVSAYCEVLDRGTPADFGRLLAEGGLTPSALSVSVLNRACDQATLLLLQGPGQYTEVCLLFVLAILRDGRCSGSGTGSTLLTRTKESLVEALQLIADLPSKQGLLAGLLQTQLSR